MFGKVHPNNLGCRAGMMIDTLVASARLKTSPLAVVQDKLLRGDGAKSSLGGLSMSWNDFEGYYQLIRNSDGTFAVPGPGLEEWESWQYWGIPGAFVYDDNLGIFVPGDKVLISYDGDGIWCRYIGHFRGEIIVETIRGPDKVIFLSNNGYPGGTIITPVVESVALCFLAGTLIGCPGGERPVEDLAIGDVVSTADGGTRRVKWIGRQTVMPRFADPLHGRPIRIRAGALADGVPSRDLCVSPDHALLVDGSLVQAGALVDGIAVERMSDLPERFVYFHVEAEDHALILAENTPAETFVDNVTRRRFDNWREYEDLYGVEELDVVELELPRVRSSRQLPRPIATRLAARAKQLFGRRRRGKAA